MDFGRNVRIIGAIILKFLLRTCSEYPEDRFRDICHIDPVYGTLDLTERDTSL